MPQSENDSKASHFPMRACPPSDRPRERLIQVGAEALSDRELLAILLGTGGRGQSALELGQSVLHQIGGLAELGRCSIIQLAAVRDVGLAKAARIVAACELGRRRERGTFCKRKRICSVKDAVGIARSRLRDARKECVLVLFLDVRHHLIDEHMVSVGNSEQAVVEPRDILRLALERSASALIMAHNHPSGDSQPSPADCTITEKLQSAAGLLSIRFLDHIIIAHENYFSMAERGVLKKTWRQNIV